MKRTLICAAIALSVSALPIVSEARGDDRGDWGQHGGYSHGGGGRGDYNHGGGGRGDYDRGGRGDYRGHGDYHHGNGFERAALFPFILGAAAIGAVATIVSAPFNAGYDAPPPSQVYYGGSTTYYDAPPPPPPTVYYGAPSYGRVVPQQTCTYYPDGSSYCR